MFRKDYISEEKARVHQSAVEALMNEIDGKICNLYVMYSWNVKK
jgi:hypothetical protein